MSSKKCSYINCKYTAGEKSLFRFPAHDECRVAEWIRNSGNPLLETLTDKELRKRFICAAHFSHQSISKGNVRNRLIGLANPVHFETDSVLNDKDTDEACHFTQDVTKNAIEITKYGHCRCCLKKENHPVGNSWEMLGCLNVQLHGDPRISTLVCDTCGKFLRQVQSFRDMVAASQDTLLTLSCNKLQVIDSEDAKYDPGIGQGKQMEEGDDSKEMVQVIKSEESDPCFNVIQIVDIKPDLPDNLTDETQEGAALMLNRRVQIIYEDDEDYIKKDLDTEQNVSLTDVNQRGTATELLKEVETHVDKRVHTISDDDDDRMDGVREHANTQRNDAKRRLTAREVKNKTKKKDARLKWQIRKNQSTILQYSTLIPFTTAKGDLYECIYCDNNYVQFKELRDHVENIHKDEAYEFKFQAMNLIPELILRTDINNLKCKICNEIISDINALVQHLIKEHDKKFHDISRNPPHNVLCFDMANNLRCLDCGKGFSSFRGLLMHMNQHYGSHVCPDCGAKFLYEQIYKLHFLQKHQPGPNWKCWHCNGIYNTKQYLKRHLQVQHSKVWGN